MTFLSFWGRNSWKKLSVSFSSDRGPLDLAQAIGGESFEKDKNPLQIPEFT